MAWNFLDWKNRFEGDLTQPLLLDGVYDPVLFPDEDTKITVVHQISLAEFTKLYSAIIKGAILSYPNEYEQVAWIFLRAFEMPVDLCQLIADCINDPDSPSRQAVRDLVTTDPDINNYFQQISSVPVVGSEQLGQNLFKPDACELNFVFNMNSQMVTLLNSLSRDLFQAIEVGTNSLERASLVIGAIPGLGILPFDEILKFGDELVENIFEDYDGAYDEGMYDDLRCGLFCATRDSCTMTIEDVLNYYLDKLGESIPTNPIDTLQAIAQFLLTGDIPGETTVYAMHLLVIACMRAGQELFGIDFAQLAIRIQAAGDEPNNDWILLCEECRACEGTWPDPMTFYQGNITGRTGNTYDVDLVADTLPGYHIIRTSEYDHWEKGAFMLVHVETVGGTPSQLYVESEDGTLVYNGTDASVLNLSLPACVRYFQAVQYPGDPSFSVKLEIDT